ncbi:MAG: acyltransferase [wastewater metagenome]|nr:acyltransferase [Candidatus Loosdrechtia aerotolerans]
MISHKLRRLWAKFWMYFSGLGFFGRIATRIAMLFAPPHSGCRYLARANSKGYISPRATVYHANLKLGAHIFIGDRVTIFQDKNGGEVEIGERVHLYGDTFIQTGAGGSIKIGADTHIQSWCQFSAYKGNIIVGSYVQIAPRCSFYPYAHDFAPGELIMKQGLKTKGNIIIEDDVWLGCGVIVLDGIRIGKGAVVGAGSVVTHDIPAGSIAAGIPARIIKMRS